MEALLRKAEGVAEADLRQVCDFMRFVKMRHDMVVGTETVLADMSAHAKDWLYPEEDEAGQRA